MCNYQACLFHTQFISLIENKLQDVCRVNNCGMIAKNTSVKITYQVKLKSCASAPCHEDIWRDESKSPFLLNFVTRWRSVGSFKIWTLHPWEYNLCISQIGGCVGSKPCRDAAGNTYSGLCQKSCFRKSASLYQVLIIYEKRIN